MIYQTAHIKNFRGIEELKLDYLGLLNVFVGGNSVGKTSILEALALGTSIIDADEKIHNINETDEDFTSVSQVIDSALISVVNNFRSRYTDHFAEGGDGNLLPKRFSVIRKMVEGYDFYKTNLFFVDSQGNRKSKISILLDNKTFTGMCTEDFQQDSPPEIFYEIGNVSDLNQNQTLPSNHSTMELPIDPEGEILKMANRVKTVLALKSNMLYFTSTPLNVMRETYRAVEKLQDNIHKLDILLEFLRETFPQHNLQDLRLKSTEKIICRMGSVFFPLEVMGEGFKKILLIQSKLLGAVCKRHSYLFLLQ
ncbi:MAG: AAA family ATPase [Vampirovibrionales bacterium]